MWLLGSSDGSGRCSGSSLVAIRLLQLLDLFLHLYGLGVCRSQGDTGPLIFCCKPGNLVHQAAHSHLMCLPLPCNIQNLATFLHA